ncbi:MAG: ABC transporter substrate-binding protein [Bradyrhizobiaceae bacterium]|nr:ABC transporter substrate-binding protein [Bradyrhizobiaceae bacterium]
MLSNSSMALRSATLALGAGLAFTAPAAAQDVKVWRHGIIEAKSDAGILYMASRRDVAARLGLRIEFVQLKADTIALKALLAGELDSCEGGAGGTMAAASHGADVKIVGCHWLVPPHGVYARPGITAMADLKGKAVAVSSPGSFPEIFARAAFERAGLAGQVRFAAMGSDTDRYKALIAGVVDGAIISNEYVPIAGRIGGEAAIHDLMPAARVMPDFIRVCIEMTGSTLRERRPTAVRFLAAEIDGLRFAMSHRDETIRVASEIAGLKPDDPRPGFVFDAAVAAKAVAPDLPLPLEKLDFMQKVLVSAGTLTQPADVTKMIDARLREEALALLATGP